MELWRVLDAIRTGTHAPLPFSPILARGLQFMLRTAQRGGEVFTMERGDVDEASGWWTIPGTKTKNGTMHRVPLTQAALALITEAPTDGSGPDGLVFAGREGRTLEWQARICRFITVSVTRQLSSSRRSARNPLRHDL